MRRSRTVSSSGTAGAAGVFTGRRPVPGAGAGLGGSGPRHAVISSCPARVPRPGGRGSRPGRRRRSDRRQQQGRVPPRHAPARGRAARAPPPGHRAAPGAGADGGPPPPATRRPFAQGAEGDLGLGLGPDPGRLGAVAAGVAGIVGVEDLGPTGGWESPCWATSTRPFAPRATMTSSSPTTPAPRLGALVAVGCRVADGAEAHGLVVADDTGLTQGRGVGLGRQQVEVGDLLPEHVERSPGARLAVLPGR